MGDENFKKHSGKYSFEPRSYERGESLEPELKMYEGPVLGPPVLDELRVWAEILKAIKDGIPKPYDTSIIVKKIIRLERETGENLEELKNCCPPMAEVREAKELKPLIFGILDRIIDIGGISNYVSKHER